jgi:SAM-dependent methyltransferase
MTAPPTLPPQVWNLLACPHCGGALARGAAAAMEVRCVSCGTDFAAAPSGQMDLRLRHPQRRAIDVLLAPPVDALDTRGVQLGRLPRQSPPPVDVTRVVGPCHLPNDLRTWFPRAAQPDGAAAEGGGEREPCLDLGCGAQVHKEVCELAGFEYVGLDYSTPEAMILGDAQALPFRDGAFAFVLTVAVLEHVPFPLLMMREAFRVLRPGGKLVGTVAFLEPFHQNSFHHHTHLGTLNALRTAGFRVQHIAPSGGWPGLVAQAHMGLFPNTPRWLARLLVAPLLALHKLWWMAGRLADPSADETRRLLKNSGAILFLASKDE